MIASTQDLPSIQRTFHGGTECISFGEFASNVIQEQDVAVSIATTMLSRPDIPYEDNVDEPEFYETYLCLDAELLRDQITAADGLPH